MMLFKRYEKYCKLRKSGHTGTLDPFATGVLPILIGQATKASKYLVEHNKTYIATIKLGEKTQSGDCETNVIQSANVKDLCETEINAVLKSFIGKSMQVRPVYSAIKKNGKKLYEYARQGIKVEVEPRKVEIYNIELMKWENNKKEITYKVECSKGTYIRSLSEDIAKKLNTLGYTKSLIRTGINEFSIKDAVKIENINNKQKVLEKIIPLENLFKNKEEINLEDKKYKHFINGVMLTVDKKDNIYRIYNNGIFVGIGKVKDNLLKRDIIASGINF